jgi:hypothetical protein
VATTTATDDPQEWARELHRISRLSSTATSALCRPTSRVI